MKLGNVNNRIVKLTFSQCSEKILLMDTCPSTDYLEVYWFHNLSDDSNELVQLTPPYKVLFGDMKENLYVRKCHRNIKRLE